VSARFFDRRAMRGRGKQPSAARHCADCHGISTPIAGGGPAVVKWGSLADPWCCGADVESRAGHAGGLSRRKNIQWAASRAELSHILVYLQNLPETRDRPHHFEFPPSTGRQLSKRRAVTLPHRRHGHGAPPQNQTLTDSGGDVAITNRS